MHEGLDTSNLSKNELYELVSSTYLLPPCSSKGLTRNILLQTHRDDIYSLEARTYKKFEVELSKAQLKKVGIMNNALLVRKLNMLHRLRGEKELGFSEFEIPDQNWLYKIARYADQTNLLEFFETAVVPEPALS